MKNKCTTTRVLIFVTCIFMALGLSVFFTGYLRPVYKVPEAPDIVTRLVEKLPMEQRANRWYQELKAYDTGHKQFTDWGRGLISVSIGALISLVFAHLMKNADSMKREKLLMGYFLGLWIIKVPLLLWYHFIRVNRHDYPYWADSGLPWIISGTLATCAGYVVFSAVINSALENHSLPGIVNFKAHFRKFPLRNGLLICWIGYLFFRIIPGVYIGDESSIISNVATIYIVLLLLTASPIIE